VQFVNPPGRITNANFPAPVNNYMPTLSLVLSAVQRALLAFSPKRRSAPDGFGTGAMTIGYRGTAAGARKAVQYELFTPSLGASDRFDGAFGAMPVIHITPSAPIEILETEFPTRLRRCEPKVDSGGAGTHRGGLGYIREYELLDETIFTLRAGGFRSDSWGVAGGVPGMKGQCLIDSGDGEPRAVPSLYTTNLPAGTVLRVDTAGGSGFGDAKRRDREAVLADVRNRCVSPAAAERDYGVRVKEHADGTLTIAAEGE
jgi:N-methylhydantoinase B